MALKPNSRRAEFDELTTGWGADSLVDLRARQQLLGELFTSLGGFTAAEQKISDAIAARANTLAAAIDQAHE